MPLYHIEETLKRQKKTEKQNILIFTCIYFQYNFFGEYILFYAYTYDIFSVLSSVFSIFLLSLCHVEVLCSSRY